MAEIDLTADVMLALRNGTAAAHKQLEATAVFAQLMKESVTTTDYARALRVMLQFYAMMEPCLKSGLLAHLPDYAYTPRFPLLQNDLQQLGMSANIQEDIRLQSPPGKAATLGMLYVVEGSTLGGQVLARHLYARLGERLALATSIYNLGGKLTHDHWMQVQKTLRVQADQDVDIEHVVHAATECFYKLLAYAAGEQGTTL